MYMAGTVLIYGGSGAIGSAAAGLLYSRGYHLHLVGRDEEKLAAAAAKYDAGYTVGDVADEAFFARAAAEAAAADGTLAGLIYAVGTINLKSLQRFGNEEYLQDFRINALGAVSAVRASVKHLKKYSEPASVVFFSSIAARRGFTFHSSVAMAKGAIEGLTVSLAAELAPKVRVNAVALSLTKTPLAAALVGNEKTAEAIAASHPIPRLGEPEDAAQAAVFLIGPESGWMTGQVLGVDGGRSAVLS
jgi:NAD(P)-dependent dehydrogenase (short-subunit alcohol dehydrogenase family)